MRVAHIALYFLAVFPDASGQAARSLCSVRRAPVKIFYYARQQPERSGAHESDEGERITYQ